MAAKMVLQQRQVTNLGLKAEASGTEGEAARLGAPPLPEGKWLPHRGSSVNSLLMPKNRSSAMPLGLAAISSPVGSLLGAKPHE